MIHDAHPSLTTITYRRHCHSASAMMGDRESTKLVLEVVQVAENNGLKLPREFGLLLKQVSLK